MSAVTATENSTRTVAYLIQGQPTSDGAGVKLTRLIGSQDLNTLDPFLLLDQFESENANDYIGGFPSHPHRGFETVTYLLAGKMRHKDNAGNEGVIQSGGVQWMTAGRGIVHSEMPEQEDGLLKGFQLWVNLPAKDKMTAPAYQEVTADEIQTEKHDDGVAIKVIAGQTNNGTQGAIKNQFVQTNYFDVSLPAGTEFQQSLTHDDNAFVYVIEGEVLIGTQTIATKQLAELSTGEEVIVKANTNTQLLFVSAPAINEPIARGGPFVMNSKEEVLRAFEDFRNNRF